MVSSKKVIKKYLGLKMLTETVHFPSAYQYIDERDIGAIIQILRDVLAGGVILQNPSSIKPLVENWPTVYRKKGQEIFEQLEKRKRFIDKVVSQSNDLDLCDFSTCSGLYNIFRRSNGEVYVILSNDCLHCHTIQEENVVTKDDHIVNFREYQLSGLPERIHANLKLSLSNREWNKLEFERKVLVPILRHTKKLKIYDRQIGRTVTIKEGKVSMKKGFERDLKWIIDTFIKNSSPDFVEICCGLYPKKDDKEDEVDAKKKFLLAWGEKLTREHRFPVNMRVKREEPNNQAPHARYIVTDQVCLLVERGFELTNDDNSIRDVALVLMEEPGELDVSFNRLGDIERA